MFEENGQLYSLDNRRLFVGQLNDAEVPVRYATPTEYNNAFDRNHFSSKNGGVGVRVRGGYGYFQFPSVDLADVV